LFDCFVVIILVTDCDLNVSLLSHLPTKWEGYVFGSVYVYVCVCVSSITAKVISRFHWNLVWWFGLPIGKITQHLVVIGFQKEILDHFASSLQN